jgi:hypothetical protein
MQQLRKYTTALAVARQPSAAYTKDRPVLSSERAPHKNNTVTVKTVINIWS